MDLSGLLKTIVANNLTFSISPSKRTHHAVDLIVEKLDKDNNIIARDAITITHECVTDVEPLALELIIVETIEKVSN